ncbi:MAG: hypothetical protein KC422_01840 [Trueperaceae bacterium]|nr:hypothetical protein [Trueperaceae bacterium]
MKPKDIRRLLADARERKQNLIGKNIRIDWSKSVFLVSEAILGHLASYFEETHDTFALKHDASSNLWYLFDVRLVVDPSLLEESQPELAIVLESSRRW